MSKSIRVSPVELFFLGKYMQAKYIDYAYVAAMPDIQKRFSLFEEQALESLEEKDLVEEDFSGNVEVSEEAVRLLEPVFFGGTESTVAGRKVIRVHTFKGRITIVEMDQVEGEGVMTLREASDADLRKFLTENIHIRCSNVERGFSEKTFSKEQLSHEDRKTEALKMIKGEL